MEDNKVPQVKVTQDISEKVNQIVKFINENDIGSVDELMINERFKATEDYKNFCNNSNLRQLVVFYIQSKLEAKKQKESDVNIESSLSNKELEKIEAKLKDTDTLIHQITLKLGELENSIGKLNESVSSIQNAEPVVVPTQVDLNPLENKLAIFQKKIENLNLDIEKVNNDLSKNKEDLEQQIKEKLSALANVESPMYSKNSSYSSNQGTFNSDSMFDQNAFGNSSNNQSNGFGNNDSDFSVTSSDFGGMGMQSQNQNQFGQQNSFGVPQQQYGQQQGFNQQTEFNPGVGQPVPSTQKSKSTYYMMVGGGVLLLLGSIGLALYTFGIIG